MNTNSTEDLNFESDPRLPSGQWSGFFLDDRLPRRGWMHLYINFQEGSIQGEGTDCVGPWVINGSYDTNTGSCLWTKQYVGKHRVNYSGRLSDQGIQGTWDIHSWLEGLFHIWPNHRTDLQQLYMQDEIDAGDPSMPLGTVPKQNDSFI